ncbi:MAG: hypothetical protein ACR2NN_19215, partial [Bryobacteraceae bacterium]
KRRARMQKRSSFYPLTPNQKGVPAPDRSASYPGSFFDEKMLAAPALGSIPLTSAAEVSVQQITNFA